MSATSVPTNSRLRPTPHRTRRERPITVADLRGEVRAVLRSRWPGTNPDYVEWRIIARFNAEAAAGRRPDDLTVWTRSVVYGLVVDDQRADQGQRQHARELDVLLRELSRPATPLIGRALLAGAVAHLHPRDVIILRMLLAGHRGRVVARRVGVPVGEVDLAYSRARARLRAAIGSDPELCNALQQAHEIISVTLDRTYRSRSSRRPRFTRFGRPEPDRFDVA